MRGKKPNRGDYCSQLLGKLFPHSHSWWRLSAHHFWANFNNGIQLMPLSNFSDCPFSVCSSQEFWSDWWIFVDFRGICGKRASVQGRIIRALLWYLDRTKSWFWCPAVQLIMTHKFFASSVGSWMGLDSSFDDHWNWVAMDSVASISAPTFSWLRISHVSRPSVLWRHLCLGKDPGLGSLLGLKAECLPQKRDLRLLMPYNLWLHKHFCFCGLGSSSQSEYSWKRGGRRQEVWRVLF